VSSVQLQTVTRCPWVPNAATSALARATSCGYGQYGRITANAATLAGGFTSDVEAHANTGGVVIAGDDDCSKPTSGCVRATIRHSLVSGNTATASNTGGDATGFGGGIVVDGSLVLSTSLVRDNRVRVTVPAGSKAGAFGDSGGRWSWDSASGT
jgi:hypothetical protein